jgi:hypothetical protein
MAGPINTGSHPKALWPGIKEWWGTSYSEHPLECMDLFEWSSSNQSYEEMVQTKGFGLAPIKTEGNGIAYDSELQGFVKRFTHVAYALGYIVTYEEMRDNLYEYVSKRRSASNAFSQRQTREVVSAAVYNRGFDSNYVGGDGIELFSQAHPSSAGNWQNELTTPADLSELALEDMVILVMGAKNDKGLQISLMSETLHVPRQLVFEAHRILKSVLQNDTANNATNALRAMSSIPGGIKPNHYFTDSDAWFVRTQRPKLQGMVGLDREKLSFDKENDFDTKNAKASSYARYSVGWVDPRAIFASEGA